MTASDANIVLIGYRGVGKTSVARELSARLDRPWFDADEEVERVAGHTIAEIFAAEGEAAFRDWESQIIARLAERRGAILSTGGGAILRAENCEALSRHGRVVWLQAEPETIHARIQADAVTAARRPSLTRLGELDEIRALLAARGPIYAALAEVTIDTEGKTVAALADEIVAALNLAERTGAA